MISAGGIFYIPFDKYYVSSQNQVVVIKRTKINPNLINLFTGDYNTIEDFFIIGNNQKLIYVGEYNSLSSIRSNRGSKFLSIGDGTLLVADGCRIHIIGEKNDLNYNKIDNLNCSEDKGERYFGIFQGSGEDIYVLRFGSIGSENDGYGGELLKVNKKGEILRHFQMDTYSSMQIFFYDDRILVSNRSKNSCLDLNLNVINQIDINHEWNVGYMSSKLFFGMGILSKELFILQKDNEKCFKEYAIIEDKKSLQDDYLVQVNNFDDGRFFYYLAFSENLCFLDYSISPIRKNCFNLGGGIDYLRKEDENTYEAIRYKDLYFGYSSLRFKIINQMKVEIIQDWETKQFK